MKISTKGRYALRMMIDLAEHQNDGYTALKDIAKRQNISKKYLEQIVPIFNDLVQFPSTLKQLVSLLITDFKHPKNYPKSRRLVTG